MSGKDLKLNSCWFRERKKKTSDVKESKIEDLQATEHLSKHENKLKVCSFVQKCITNAQQKKTSEISLKNLTASKKFSYPSTFIKFNFLYVNKVFDK